MFDSTIITSLTLLLNLQQQQQKQASKHTDSVLASTKIQQLSKRGKDIANILNISVILDAILKDAPVPFVDSFFLRYLWEILRKLVNPVDSKVRWQIRNFFLSWRMSPRQCLICLHIAKFSKN